jgi:hypothetical protein
VTDRVIAEARHVLGHFEPALGASWDDVAVSSQDQVLAAIRDHLRDYGVNTVDPQQVRSVLAGMLLGAEALAGGVISVQSMHRLCCGIRAIVEWKVGSDARPLFPDQP